VACEESLNICILSLTASLGALVTALVALVKSKEAHRMSSQQYEEEKEV